MQLASRLEQHQTVDLCPRTRLQLARPIERASRSEQERTRLVQSREGIRHKMEQEHHLKVLGEKSGASARSPPCTTRLSTAGPPTASTRPSRNDLRSSRASYDEVVDLPPTCPLLPSLPPSQQPLRRAWLPFAPPPPSSPSPRSLKIRQGGTATLPEPTLFESLLRVGLPSSPSMRTTLRRPLDHRREPRRASPERRASTALQERKTLVEENKLWGTLKKTYRQHSRQRHWSFWAEQSASSKVRQAVVKARVRGEADSIIFSLACLPRCKNKLLHGIRSSRRPRPCTHDRRTDSAHRPRQRSTQRVFRYRYRSFDSLLAHRQRL